MGDRKQKGDSKYCDSEFDPNTVDFLLREEFADEPEEPHTLASSSTAAAASCTLAADFALWESDRAEFALRESISLGETPDTTGFSKATSKTHPKWGPRPPYPPPSARGRPVLHGKELPPVPVFDTTRQVDKDPSALDVLLRISEGIKAR